METASRVRAREILDIQKDDESLILEDDTESQTTIYAQSSDLSSERIVKLEDTPLDFSHELQKTRVYRRSQGSQGSVSALTKSTYSVGWSCLSDLSMVEVSDTSVFNLAITEREASNPRRSTQIWSAGTGQKASADHYLDRQQHQPRLITHDDHSTIAQKPRTAALHREIEQ